MQCRTRRRLTLVVILASVVVPLMLPGPAASAAHRSAVRSNDLEPPDDATAATSFSIVNEVEILDLEGDAFYLVNAAGLDLRDALVAGAEAQPEMLDEVLSVLRTMEADGEPVGRAIERVEAVVNDGAAAAPDVDQDDPPQVGYAINNNRTWYIHRWLNGFFCEKHDRCVETDRIDVKFWVNPGAQSTLVQWNRVGMIGDRLKSLRVSATANFDGSDRGGASEAIEGRGQGQLVVRHRGFRRGKDVRHFVKISGTLTCGGLPGCNRSADVFHDGSTGRARCRTEDNVCTY
jgi:hypothetical protein